MSIVKSFSVGNGDMFYINHGNDNFTTIDCCVSDENKKEIFKEIKNIILTKGITRFISTHPDDDHIMGLKKYNDEIGISNFYCVENSATKDKETEDFKEYCNLKNGSKHYYIYNGCSRKWMNKKGEDDKGNNRGSSGINILWPDVDNEFYKQELKKVKNGESPNNISPIISYTLENGVKILWFGDLENSFMENIKDSIDLNEADIIFAPHHGRESGKIPKELLDKISPKLIVIGEAPSSNLNYYNGYNTITQNSAGDIIFDCNDSKVHIYVSKEGYKVDFLNNENRSEFDNYIGSMDV